MNLSGLITNRFDKVERDRKANRRAELISHFMSNGITIQTMKATPMLGHDN